MTRILFLIYGILCYGISFIIILYTMGFVGDVIVPKSVSTGLAGPILPAVLVNLGLLLLFGIQHSVMARPAFKKWAVRRVPAPIERSTYILVSSLVLGLLFALWQPLPQTIWYVTSMVPAGVLWLFYGIGWATVLLSTFLLNHFSFLGIQQVVDHARSRASDSVPFRTPFLYRIVRHPLMLGLLIAFWSAPHLTLGRLVLALGMTIYIFIGLFYEERDLTAALGEDYIAYRQRVPQVVPGLSAARPNAVRKGNDTVTV